VTLSLHVDFITLGSLCVITTQEQYEENIFIKSVIFRLCAIVAIDTA